jgi:hypothetical protein
MKNRIAFIFAHRETDIWSTPLSVVNQFKQIGWETKIYSLFDNRDQYVDTNFINIENDGFNPNIVLYMDWGRFDSPKLGFHLFPKAYWVMESGDDPQNFDKNSAKAHKFNLVLTPDHESYLKYQNMGCDVLWWTHFADTNIHKIYDDINNINNLSVSPVRCTRGKNNTPVLDYLSQVLGSKFDNTSNLYGQQYGKFLSGGLITLQISRWGEITRRIFEGMACGTMVITDRLNANKKMDLLFTENEDIVYYDDLAECISKINYYLYNFDEQRRIAFNGYKKVLEGHTQVKRLEQILKKYECHK